MAARRLLAPVLFDLGCQREFDRCKLDYLKLAPAIRALDNLAEPGRFSELYGAVAFRACGRRHS